MDVGAADRYDFSEYPLDHPLYDASNHNARGLFKDELNSVQMREFVGLRPKCYSFLWTGKMDKNVVQHTRPMARLSHSVVQHTRPMEKKTAKGVKRKVKDDHLHFNHYLDALRNFPVFVCK